MAEEQKPTPDSTSISPAPTDAVETKPGQAAPAAKPAAPAVVNGVQAEPLPDGTVPTVITPGDSHHSVAKGKASISTVYRRADVLTTLLTFAGVVVAGVIIVGIYYFVNVRNKPKATPTNSKVTTLDKSELSKLGAFFEGNSAGDAGQVLTITSSTLFKNRIATSADLKVLGGAEISGPANLSDLNVEKISTLGVTNVRGQLTVAGPASLNGALLVAAGASIKGNVSVAGAGAFTGPLSAPSLTVTDLSVAGTINLAGHLSISGQNSSASAGSEAGAGATASVDGNDTSGTITINTGTIPGQAVPAGGLLGRLNFRTTYPRAPKVLITPVGPNAANLKYYVIKTANNFIIGSSTPATSGTQYVFDYWVIQ